MTANNPDTEAALLRLGKMQLEDWFAHNDRNPLDDSEFVPIMVSGAASGHPWWYNSQARFASEMP